MRIKEYLVLFILAALWGASFLFIKVAINDVSPLVLVCLRLTIGALGLLVFVPFKPAIMKGWQTQLKAFCIVTIFNTIIPYITISWGETHVTSGMAAILNATTPLALILISLWQPNSERLTWQRLGAVSLGLVGVTALVGPSALSIGASPLYWLSVLACLIGAASYAFGSLLVKKLLTGLPMMQQAIGQIGMGAAILLPITALSTIIQPPTHLPSTAAILAILALALGGTTLAYICYFWLIERVGPTRTVFVTYLLPCMALVYGALFLHETIALNSIAGLVLVLAGIFLAGRKTANKAVSVVEAVPLQQKS